MTAISPLEPLLPAGEALRVLVVGGGDPATLLPASAAAADEDLDLVLLLPARQELRRRSWLREAATRAAGALGEDGIAYALVPRGFRRRARAELERAGLFVELPFAHLPDAAAPRYLVPLEQRVLSYALERLISARPRARALLRSLLALPFGERLLRGTLPAVGLAARRPDGRPLAVWTSRIAGAERETSSAIVQTSWRGPAGSVTVHCFAAREAMPWAVAKVGAAEHDEGHALQNLGRAAELAGVRVPSLLGRTTLDGRPVVVETHVPGRPAAVLLAAAPQRLNSFLESLAGWLARWGRATATLTTLDRAVLDEHVLAAAASVEALLPPGSGYRAWLESRCEEMVGRQGPLVAAHNDLTMWNVVVEPELGIGVLDWETAEQCVLPLVDFFYAVTDAVAATERYRSRLNALQSCFSVGGSRTHLVANLQAHVASAVGVDPSVVELAFHACWLRHASNEHASAAGETQFIEIVRWLAKNTQRVLR